MTEPVSTTAVSAGASTGLFALLAAHFGLIQADVILVVLSALSGSFIALSEVEGKSAVKTILFILMSVFISTILSYPITELLRHTVGTFNSIYTPSIVSFCLSAVSNHYKDMPTIIFSTIGNIWDRILRIFLEK